MQTRTDDDKGQDGDHSFTSDSNSESRLSEMEEGWIEYIKRRRKDDPFQSRDWVVDEVEIGGNRCNTSDRKIDKDLLCGNQQ